MGGGTGGNFGNTRGSSMTYKELLDVLSDSLTLASLISGIDTITDLAAIPIDLARGDFIGAGLDLIGAVPFVGEVADAAKIARITDKATDAARVTNKASDIGKVIKKVSPSELTRTHRLTLSKKQYNDLVDSIRKNGITEPIKYVEHNGSKYVVDGHHRLQAAKQLKLDKIPVEKVSLPYKGYKSIEDLLWYD